MNMLDNVTCPNCGSTEVTIAGASVTEGRVVVHMTCGQNYCSFSYVLEEKWPYGEDGRHYTKLRYVEVRTEEGDTYANGTRLG